MGNTEALTAERVSFPRLASPPHDKASIRREAVLDRVFHDDCPQIVLFQSPAGYGKSTVLRQIRAVCEAEGDLTGWLAFDEADNDIARCLIHLQRLLCGVSPDPTGARRPDPANVRHYSGWLIDRFIDLGRPVALFFDEFEVLGDASVLAFFKRFLNGLPSTVRLFIGSRTVPPIGLPRLAVNDRALVLGEDTLRFSPAEADRFFAGFGRLPMSTSELDAVYQHTEGWPVGLQLFRLTLGVDTVRESLGDLGKYQPRALVEYLIENILDLQRAAIQDFLLKTGPLTRLTAPLCDYVTGRRNSRDILLWLESSGLFVRATDVQHKSFEYHAVFASFLTEQLRTRSETAVRETHRKAAEWYRDNDQQEDALYHALEAGELDLAVEAMAIVAGHWVADGQLATLERWCARLPWARIEVRPDVIVKLAYALILLHRADKFTSIVAALDRAELDGAAVDTKIVSGGVAFMADDIPRAWEIMQQVEAPTTELDHFSAVEAGAAANLTGLLAICAGDFERARDHIGAGLDYSARAGAAFIGYYSVALACINQIAQGRLNDALDQLQTAMSHSPTQLAAAARSGLVACHIYALYLADRLEDADRLFDTFKDDISQTSLLDMVGLAYRSAARTRDALGRRGEADEILDEAAAIARRARWPRLMRMVDQERARRALLGGDLGLAVALTTRIKDQAAIELPAGWVPLADDMEGDAIGRIRLDIARSRLDEALRLVKLELATAQTQRRIPRQITLLVLRAIVQHHKGARSTAHRSLRAAIELAQPGGFIRVFIDEGDALRALLLEAYDATKDAPGYISGNHQAVRAFLETLVSACGQTISQSLPVDPAEMAVPLTEREIEILHLLPQGASVKEIARRTYVSENTVKFHLKNIYSKLHVSNRLQAINRLFDFDRAISMKSGLRPAVCGCSGIVSGGPSCLDFGTRSRRV